MLNCGVGVLGVQGMRCSPLHTLQQSCFVCVPRQLQYILWAGPTTFRKALCVGSWCSGHLQRHGDRWANVKQLLCKCACTSAQHCSAVVPRLPCLCKCPEHHRPRHTGFPECCGSCYCNGDKCAVSTSRGTDRTTHRQSCDSHDEGNLKRGIHGWRYSVPCSAGCAKQLSPGQFPTQELEQMLLHRTIGCALDTFSVVNGADWRQPKCYCQQAPFTTETIPKHIRSSGEGGALDGKMPRCKSTTFELSCVSTW